MSAPALRLLALALLLVALAGCKPPRSPREAAQGSLTGAWTGISPALDPRTGHEGAAELRWRMELEERHAGKLAGRGAVAGATDSAAFTLDGLRGESEVTLKLDLAGERAIFRGSVLDPGTLVGEMETPRGRVRLAFTRGS